MTTPRTCRQSAYDNFKLPAKPWKWCHSEFHQDNPWRVAVTHELRRLVDIGKSHNLIADFEMSDANNDTGGRVARTRNAGAVAQPSSSAANTVGKGGVS